MTRKTAESLIRRFAVSEALYRGTALSSNLILISIIATEKRFGAEAVLISAFIQFLISGLLEIPTGRYADRTGWYRSVEWGLKLKVLTTLCYAGAVLCVYTIGAWWAWVLIAAESIIDSFANAFINGAYQAAYGHWYDANLADNGIKKTTAPPLFVSSYRYSLLLRLLFPITGITLGTVLFEYGPKSGSGGAVYLCLLGYVLLLRLLVIGRTKSDLKPLAERQKESLAKQTYPPLADIFKIGRNALILYAFANLALVACGFYLYGEIYKSLSAIAPSIRFLWVGGTLIGFLMNTSGIVMSRGIVKRAEVATPKEIKIWLPAGVGVLSFASVALLLRYDSPRLHAFILFVYCLLSMTAANLIQRWIVSHEMPSIRSEIRATWLSAGEVLGLLIFGLLAGVSLLSGIPQAGMWTFLVSIGLVGIGLAMWPAFTRSAKFS